MYIHHGVVRTIFVYTNIVSVIVQVDGKFSLFWQIHCSTELNFKVMEPSLL